MEIDGDIIITVLDADDVADNDIEDKDNAVVVKITAGFYLITNVNSRDLPKCVISIPLVILHSKSQI